MMVNHFIDFMIFSFSVGLHDNPQGDGQTLLLINLSSQAITVELRGLGRVKGCYELGASKPTSRKLRINGTRPRLREGRVKLADFPAQPPSGEIQGQSINFWCLGTEVGS